MSMLSPFLLVWLLPLISGGVPGLRAVGQPGSHRSAPSAGKPASRQLSTLPGMVPDMSVTSMQFIQSSAGGLFPAAAAANIHCRPPTIPGSSTSAHHATGKSSPPGTAPSEPTRRPPVYARISSAAALSERKGTYQPSAAGANKMNPVRKRRTTRHQLYPPAAAIAQSNAVFQPVRLNSSDQSRIMV